MWFLLGNMEFKIKKLPKVKISEIDSLPTTSCIYFAMDTTLRVWYVGASENLRDALKTEQMYSSFVANRVYWIAYFLWEDWEDLMDWERDCLIKFNPPLNKTTEEYGLPITDLGYSQSQYLARYKEIQDMIKLLEREKEELKPNIISLLEENEGKIDTDNLKAWMNVRKSYIYSPQLESMRQKVSELQKNEEMDGIAQVKSILVFPVVRSR